MVSVLLNMSNQQVCRVLTTNLLYMKKLFLLLFASLLSSAALRAQTTFINPSPDYAVSPFTGMDREGWKRAAEYLLSGAFTYIHSIDDPMYFPKQHDKTYPRNAGGVVTAKLEGFCRTLFVAAPLLRENPNLEINGISVADYYRHGLVNLITPSSPSYVKHRTGGASQTLVEFGALAISLTVAPDVLWDPLTQQQKDELAATMLSYGNGPTIGSNWMFFNVFVISFFKQHGYQVNEQRLNDCLTRLLKLYRGEGWYNDAPAYDYYSMWAYQMYGPIWAHYYSDINPEYARQFVKNQTDLIDNYPYMFSAEGRMNMWGRSIPYRFASVVPLALLGWFDGTDVAERINYGWMRRIASSTLLQFLQHPDFLKDNVPQLGFYGAFEPATQVYSCRGSVFWCGKAFLGLLLPADNPFWTARENNGPWDTEFRKDAVYNKFQPATNLLITDYPNIGGAEMRSWCHESVAKDWQKFRSSENYNKLAYHTEFPWLSDGFGGNVSMNYAVQNDKGEWEVLRLYDFVSFEDGMYRRDAVLETNSEYRFQLCDIPLPDGVLRVDKVHTPQSTEVRLGHYALPVYSTNDVDIDGNIIANGRHQLAMENLYGWSGIDVKSVEGHHPETSKCLLLQSSQMVSGDQLFVTLMLWKKDGKRFTSKQLKANIKSVNVAPDNSNVVITFNDGTSKTVRFN